MKLYPLMLVWLVCGIISLTSRLASPALYHKGSSLWSFTQFPQGLIAASQKLAGAGANQHPAESSVKYMVNQGQSGACFANGLPVRTCVHTHVHVYVCVRLPHGGGTTLALPTVPHLVEAHRDVAGSSPAQSTRWQQEA